MFANIYHFLSPILNLLRNLLFHGSSGSLSPALNYSTISPLYDITSPFPTTLSPQLEAVLPYDRGIFEKILLCACFTFLTVTGVVGNSLVIFVIFTDSALQVKTQLSNLPVLNLAYMDIMTTGIVCGSGAVSVVFDEYPLGRFWCGVWGFMNLFGLIVTIGLLAVISVDRFVAVGWSLHYPQWVTYNKIFAGCAYVWINCVGICIWWVTREFEYDYPAGVCDIAWTLFGPEHPVEFYISMVNSFTYVFIPSGIILVCNLLIIYFSRDKGRVGTMDKGQGGKGKGESKANSKVLKAMVIVIVSFFALTFPSGLVKIFKLVGGKDGPSKYFPDWITTFSSMLQLGSSIVNPFIYGLFRKDFRDAYEKLWKRVKGNF